MKYELELNNRELMLLCSSVSFSLENINYNLNHGLYEGDAFLSELNQRNSDDLKLLLDRLNQCREGK